MLPESRSDSWQYKGSKLKGRAVNSQTSKNVTHLFFWQRYLALSFGNT